MGGEPTEREADVHLGRLSFVGSVQLASVPGQQCSLQTLNVRRNVRCLDFRIEEVLTCTRGPAPPSRCKAVVSAEIEISKLSFLCYNDEDADVTVDAGRSLVMMWIIGVSHLSNLLEAELIGGELIGKASRPSRELLCDVPHTVGELERHRVGQGLLLCCLNFQE